MYGYHFGKVLPSLVAQKMSQDSSRILAGILWVKTGSCEASMCSRDIAHSPGRWVSFFLQQKKPCRNCIRSAAAAAFPPQAQGEKKATAASAKTPRARRTWQ
eukprot:3301435-Karenia_brevis.AAC.1